MPGWTRRGTIAGLVAASALPPAFARTATARDFHDLAPRPPMGWNSWDSFAATINEAQARETAAIMAEKLLPAGYDIDRKSTRLTPVTNAHLVCRLLLAKKKQTTSNNAHIADRKEQSTTKINTG